MKKIWHRMPLAGRVCSVTAALTLTTTVSSSVILHRSAGDITHAAIVDACAAVFLTTAISVFVTRAILRPVRIFTRAAKRVRSGDLNFQISIPQPDEVGELAKAFNKMVASLKENREQLTEQSTRDFLTGLLNHRCFHQRLKSEIERAERYTHTLCLLTIDLDRFKTINDTLGHPVGDSILFQLGQVLQENIRGIDAAARCGGDEFAVILPETDLATAQSVAERIRRQVETHAFYAVPLEKLKASGFVADEKQIIHLTVTMGVASYPEDERTPNRLVMAADVALCRAKRISRNSVGTYGAGSGNKDPETSSVYKMLRDQEGVLARSPFSLVEKRNRWARSHAECVAAYAVAIGKAMEVEPEILDELKIAGLLHDLGKFGLPDEVLNKPGSLTSEEHDAVKQHPVIAEDILNKAPRLETVIPAVVGHHERWDGEGYPKGLSGESIPLMARILAVADAFDAMTSDRPYRKAMTVQDALVEIKANSGRQFDPEIVEVCVGNMTLKKPLSAADDLKGEGAVDNEALRIAEIVEIRRIDNSILDSSL